MPRGRHDFDPDRYEAELTAIIDELHVLDVLDARTVARVLKRYPKDGRGTFSKTELIRGFRRFEASRGWAARAPRFVEQLQTKPVRTESGVAPVTVLTKPFPCPGECVFCPSDVRMPKSYLSMEPGAQRAAQHAFDPYAQTYSRLRAFLDNGHPIDKVELIVLGGTWSHYPEPYQVWFIRRCFDAMNELARRAPSDRSAIPRGGGPDFKDLAARVDGRTMTESYNSIVSRHLRVHQGGALESPTEVSSWEELFAAQRENEAGGCRCVGLSLETRPDRVTEDEVERLRRLGATKVQLGYQSLSDEVLARNKRGHDVAATRRATELLRRAGFKVHAHWMPNLLGSTPELDIADFARLFEDPALRPDELKIYPCSLLESAELVQRHERGEWRPYTADELLSVLVECLRATPRWVRITRVIRDIPSHDILVGNKRSNLRQSLAAVAAERGVWSQDIRSREVRGRAFDPEHLELRETRYDTASGQEVFLEVLAPGDVLLGFLRLSLPTLPSFLSELGRSPIVREVHVYGRLASLGERAAGKAQHLGLGRRLIDRAAELARSTGAERMAVISAVGTRRYYSELGFIPGPLFQHRDLR